MVAKKKKCSQRCLGVNLTTVSLKQVGVEPKIEGIYPPNHPILIGFSIIHHPFWGFSPYFWNHLGESLISLRICRKTSQMSSMLSMLVGGGVDLNLDLSGEETYFNTSAKITWLENPPVFFQ